jgi:thioredoxin-related protein
MHTIVFVVVLLVAQYVPVTKYEPSRDAVRDIKDAISEAQRTGKNILLEVGGEWCSWCHILDRYFDANPKLTEFRNQNFITVKINWSPENYNEKALSQYPKINEYPFFLVLDKDGKLLQAQRTGVLEQGQSYNLDAMTGFLEKWAPKRK